MKNQKQKSLFTTALGLALFGAMLSSSTDKAPATSATQASVLQELPVSTPTSAKVAASPTSPPFTVYLSLVTAFANGIYIDFNVLTGEEPSFSWDKMNQWREEK